MKNLRSVATKFAIVPLLVGAFSAAALGAEDDFCWKDSYGRGAGTIPTDAGSGRVAIGALSYSQCPANTKRVGFDCHSVCPSGLRDDGLFCRATEYGRGVGYPWKFGDRAFSLDGARERCAAENPQGCEKNGEIIYPKCKPGYRPFGSNICRPTNFSCAAVGLNKGIDLSCAKKITIGDPKPFMCKSDLQTDAGLCYPGCRTSYEGIGPVCWGQCPTGYVSCGAGCATSATFCAEIIVDQVTSTLSLAANVASLGSSGGATAAARTAEGATRTAKLVASLKASAKAVQASPKFKAVKDTKEGIDFAMKMNEVANSTTDEEVLRAMAGFDPTGISQVINAYGRRVCSAPK
jgi:hypothetical protein